MKAGQNWPESTPVSSRHAQLTQKTHQVLSLFTYYMVDDLDQAAGHFA
ncbi:Uncharacterised protein [Serratia fonticola]|uniref:Uncharacterized protein n=1 Tax=Serratia fonticola TaxID=47917 RepID=A0A4U9W3U5_SERFO|nr:Uncharacterised protein [Serratia fonticola]